MVLKVPGIQTGIPMLKELKHAFTCLFYTTSNPITLVKQHNMHSILQVSYLASFSLFPLSNLPP